MTELPAITNELREHFALQVNFASNVLIVSIYLGLESTFVYVFCRIIF